MFILKGYILSYHRLRSALMDWKICESKKVRNGGPHAKGAN